jgi:ABC-type methionine transport system ATPase subunit
MKPTTGDVYLGGDTVASYDPWGVPWRRPVGYVSQNHGLRSNMTASENISLPLIYLNHKNRADALSTARAFLARIGIEGGNRRPSELSPGERGLVALCRALILEPAILLFDEPTVVLDVDHAERIMEVLEEMRKRIGLAIVGACTSESVAKVIGSRIIWLKNGGLEEDRA